MTYDANFTLSRNIIPLDELKSTDLLLSFMTRKSFNVNGFGDILNVVFERGSFVSKSIILMVSVPELCGYFSDSAGSKYLFIIASSLICSSVNFSVSIGLSSWYGHV